MNGRGPCLPALWLGILVVGCGRARSLDRSAPANGEPGREESPTTRPDASPAGDDDAGALPLPSDGDASCTGPECRECPAPEGYAAQAARDVWARNPATGDCCRYGDIGSPPATWPFFYTEDACQNDCRCASVDGQIDPRTSIECICSVEDCPSSIEEAEQRLCSSESFPFEPAVQRLVGCGMVIVIDRNGYSGTAWVFEQPLESTDAAVAAPRLVGSNRFSDASSETCDPFIWFAGPDYYECEDVVSCQLCGDSPGPEQPPCE
jgi:hypothetical protein